MFPKSCLHQLRWCTLVSSRSYAGKSKLKRFLNKSGFFNIPDSSSEASDVTFPLTVICDNIREPGNLGSILRVAAGVGCQRVILSKGCVDLWDSKVLRSGAGAHFQVPIISNVSWDDIPNYLSKDAQVFLADNEGHDENHHSEDLIQDVIHSQDSVETPADYSNVVPSVPYYTANFSSLKNIVLIIGGETEGISSGALKAGLTYNGLRLYIPMVNNVESLNVGTALGIITYEMFRQFATQHSSTDEEFGVAPLTSV